MIDTPNPERIIRKLSENTTRSRPPKEACEVCFCEVIWPWVAFARKLLRKEAGKRIKRLSRSARLSMEISLLKRWSALCTSSMLLEMEIQKAEFSLDGFTSRKRYLDFIQKTFLAPGALLRFFEKYEELERLVEKYLHLWVEQAVEFLQRLESDISLLEEVFNHKKTLGTVVALTTDAGDPHHGGRSVYILTFESGKSLVYKPKHLGIVASFNAFLEKLNAEGLNPPLKSYRVLAQRGYGWEEKIEQIPCQQISEVERYFERAGMLLCLLYFLDGSDAHCENIIASGEHPYLIDMETLFTKRLFAQDRTKIRERTEESVLFTGLLPYFGLAREGVRKQIDLSGLGWANEPTVKKMWIHLHTDEMRLVREPSLAPALGCQVMYKGNPCHGEAYVEQIAAGFREMYSFCQKRSVWIEEEVVRMAVHPVRIVFRATQLYVWLLEKLCDPALILDQKLREQQLDALSRYVEKSNSFILPIAAEEKRSLMQGDVPCFHAYPTSLDLYSKDVRVASEVFSSLAIDDVIKRLRGLNEKERKLQERLIDQVFAAKKAEVHGEAHAIQIDSSLPVPNEQQLLEAAVQLGDELLDESVESEDGSLEWMTFMPNLVTEQYSLRPVDDLLFSGRAGIALFFAALEMLTHQKKWRDAAWNTLKSVRQKIEQGGIERLLVAQGIGGFVGLGSLIFSLHHVGLLLQCPSLIDEAKQILDCIQDHHIEADRSSDVVFGSAGMILALCSCYEKNREPQAIRFACRCADHLCEQAQNFEDETLAWKGIARRPLLGASHGIAGIAYALLVLGRIQNHAGYQTVAQRALAYERKYFSQEQKNWPDFREAIAKYSSSWCHGATGIGIMRLGCGRFSSDPLYEKEISIAIKQTEETLTQNGHTLCCGSLGRLEFLRSAQEWGFSIDNQKKEQLLSQIVHDIKTQKKLFAYRPGLMQGAAGLGYTLLRLIDKQNRLPHLLLLGN